MICKTYQKLISCRFDMISLILFETKKPKKLLTHKGYSIIRTWNIKKKKLKIIETTMFWRKVLIFIHKFEFDLFSFYMYNKIK